MVKKKLRPVFGDRITIWDFMLIGLIAPYVYMIWNDISYAGGWGSLYQSLLAPTLAFAVIFKLLVQNLLKKTRK